MNDCADGNMRDRLPDYVHGTLPAAERRLVSAHLATCRDCTAEIEVIKAASRAFTVPAIDTARIVRAIPRARRHRFAMPVGRVQQLAAAIGIFVIGGLSVVAVRELMVRPGAASPAQAPAPATTLAAATPAPVAAPVTPTVDSTANVTAPAPAPVPVEARRPAMSFGGGLSDLSDEQLDTLLGELDGLDALPSTEPETHLTPILPPADGGHGAR